MAKEVEFGVFKIISCVKSVTDDQQFDYVLKCCVDKWRDDIKANGIGAGKTVTDDERVWLEDRRDFVSIFRQHYPFSAVMEQSITILKNTFSQLGIDSTALRMSASDCGYAPSAQRVYGPSSERLVEFIREGIGSDNFKGIVSDAVFHLQDTVEDRGFHKLGGLTANEKQWLLDEWECIRQLTSEVLENGIWNTAGFRGCLSFFADVFSQHNLADELAHAISLTSIFDLLRWYDRATCRLDLPPGIADILLDRRWTANAEVTSQIINGRLAFFHEQILSSDGSLLGKRFNSESAFLESEMRDVFVQCWGYALMTGDVRSCKKLLDAGVTVECILERFIDVLAEVFSEIHSETQMQALDFLVNNAADGISGLVSGKDFRGVLSNFHEPVLVYLEQVSVLHEILNRLEVPFAEQKRYLTSFGCREIAAATRSKGVDELLSIWIFNDILLQSRGRIIRRT